MLHLFTAGLVAGGLQSVAITITVLLLYRYGLFETTSMGAGNQPAETSIVRTAYLSGFYLLSALGLALTRNRYIDATASRLRFACRRVWPTNPNDAGTALLVQLTIAAAGFGILTLRPPPLSLVEVADAIGYADAMPVIWPAMTSILAAVFGANAHAAAEAIQR